MRSYYRTQKFYESFWIAPAYVRSELTRHLDDIVARGAQHVTQPELRAQILDDWYLLYRCPFADEQYDPDSFGLFSVERA